jgi:hypothetical protein
MLDFIKPRQAGKLGSELGTAQHQLVLYFNNFVYFLLTKLILFFNNLYDDRYIPYDYSNQILQTNSGNDDRNGTTYKLREYIIEKMNATRFLLKRSGKTMKMTRMTYLYNLLYHIFFYVLVNFTLEF